MYPGEIACAGAKVEAVLFRERQSSEDGFERQRARREPPLTYDLLLDRRQHPVRGEVGPKELRSADLTALSGAPPGGSAPDREV